MNNDPHEMNPLSVEQKLSVGDKWEQGDNKVNDAIERFAEFNKYLTEWEYNLVLDDTPKGEHTRPYVPPIHSDGIRDYHGFRIVVDGMGRAVVSEQVLDALLKTAGYTEVGPQL